jgi:hypothetical protein
VLTTWRHAPGHDVSRRGTSCIRTGLLPVIPGSQHRAHPTPLPRVGNIPFCRQSSRNCAALGPRFCRLPCRCGGRKRRSLSAKNGIAGPPATLALCLALVRRSRREVRCSHQKAVDVVSAEEGRRFSGAPLLFTEQVSFRFRALYGQARSCHRM